MLRLDDNRYKRFIDYSALKTDLRRENWNEFYCLDDIDEKTEYSIEKIKTFVEENTRKFKIRKNKRPRKRWMTPAVFVSVNKKELMYTRVLEAPE